jgi:hypothetical protein
MDKQLNGKVLVGLILSTFCRTPWPGPILLRPDSFDDTEIRDFYPFDRWQDVPDEIIQASAPALHFFSPKAYRFFLPAFLIWSIERAGESIEVVNTVLFSLPERMIVFSEDERRTVFEYLYYVKSRNRPDEDGIDVAALRRCLTATGGES